MLSRSAPTTCASSSARNPKGTPQEHECFHSLTPPEEPIIKASFSPTMSLLVLNSCSQATKTLQPRFSSSRFTNSPFILALSQSGTTGLCWGRHAKNTRGKNRNLQSWQYDVWIAEVLKT